MKIIFLSIIFLKSLFASNNAEAKIISFIFTSLLQKDFIYIYTEDKKIKEILKSTKLILAKSCLESDIVYNSKDIKSCNKPLFTNKYNILKESKKSIGAFYWKKGRPHIIFLNKRLDNFDLRLSKKLVKYGVAEL